MKKILTVSILLFASVLTYACTDKAQAQQKEPEKKEAVTPQEKLGNSVYRFDREAQRLEKAVEQAEKLDFEPGMSPVFS